MTKTILAAVAATFLAFPAAAAVETPPLNMSGQWWTNSLGCEYSRAGLPGQTMWFLIINTAKTGCPTYIKAYSGPSNYKAHGPLVRR
ncbi:MAG: hypothetical protein AAGM84_08170 [Pseudomonadota bacterium]